MATPKAWSHSALDDFKNCPYSYFRKRVVKDVVETKGAATVYGEEVHEHFEHRLRDGLVLPESLRSHEPFMHYLDSLPGTAGVEEKIALNRRLEPCEFFARDVWYRGVIDYSKVHGPMARVIDHKTGKHHTKFGQLKLFALWTFACYPDVETVKAEYYWTQTRTTGGETYTRDQIPALWAEFVPHLKQYAQAYHDDIWQCRPSGLCYGWCPVEDCMHWRPKKEKKY